MLWLSENFAPLAVAAAASAVAWMYGGARGDVLTPVVPWVFALLLEVFLCFPQRHHAETTFEARERVWRELRHSPVFWTALGLLVLLLIPFVNNGLCPGCDAALIAQGVNPSPKVSFLPFCVDRLDHLSVVLGMAMAFLLSVVVFFGLTREGKRLALEMIVWNGVAMAAFGFLQALMDAPGPFWDVPPRDIVGSGHGSFFSVFGYPNMAGDYFVTMFALAAALWRDKFEQDAKEKKLAKEADEKDYRPSFFWTRHYFLLPAAVFFFAALNTLSRAAIILVTVLAVLFFLHTLLSVLAHKRKAKRVTLGVWSLLVFGVVIFFASVFMPDRMRKEIRTLDATTVLDRVSGRGQDHEHLAAALWRDHKLFGCGGWGYGHLCMTKVPPKERKNAAQRVGGINVHNDYLQFLTEHGLVGFGALVALVVLLFWPIGRDWRQLVRESRFKKEKEQPPKPRQIFVLPAPVFFILLSALATLIHAFGDCPFRSPAILIVFFVDLAALPGFMPKLEHHSHHSHSHH